MGAGCSNKTSNTPEKKKNLSEKVANPINNLNNKNYTAYHSYEFKTNPIPASHNFIIFTQMYNFANEFTVMESLQKENLYYGSNKVQSVAVGYYKGYKIDVHNQDKFFVLVDGNVEIYCIIDGHGPYGNVVAQFSQDLIFKEIVDKVHDQDFEINYEIILNSLFEKIQNKILKRDIFKCDEIYDPYLTGAAVTIVIKKDRSIFCANVGNVMAMMFFSERAHSYKFESTELTFNHSSFIAEQGLFNNFQKIISKETPNDDYISNENESNNKPYRNSVSGFLTGETNERNLENEERKESIEKIEYMNEELRRIYECGGEVRKLAGENKSRIFVKGKYFPGLINTRSIGDQIGMSIGISCVPYKSKFDLHEKNNYYLFMCTDGITNVLNNEKIMNIIENNDIRTFLYY